MATYTHPKSVQIPYDVFIYLYTYHVGDCPLRPNEEKRINDALQNKLDALIARHHYADWHDTNLTDAEREQARQKYLDDAGIHPDWRW